MIVFSPSSCPFKPFGRGLQHQSKNQLQVGLRYVNYLACDSLELHNSHCFQNRRRRTDLTTITCLFQNLFQNLSYHKKKKKKNRPKAYQELKVNNSSRVACLIASLAGIACAQVFEAETKQFFVVWLTAAVLH